MNRCPLCHKRRIKAGDVICATCRAFIRDYIDTGYIPRRPVPLAADVLLVMERLGVDQRRAIALLGGQP